MAISTAPVGTIHWLNWLGNQMVIKDATEVIAGVVTAIQYQPAGGIFLISLGGTVLRYGAGDVITFGTPADAAPALYGVPLGQ